MSKGFTVVELFIVLTILCVFGTIVYTSIVGPSDPGQVIKVCSDRIKLVKYDNDYALVESYQCGDYEWGMSVCDRDLQFFLSREAGVVACQEVK